MSGEEKLNDKQARELLRLLAFYCHDGHERGDEPEKLTVAEVAGDLFDSLPSELTRQTDVLLDAKACRADAMTLPPEYRS
jgi:hypothetical protein